MSSPLIYLCHSHDSTQTGSNGRAALCFRSLLPNLRTLTLHGVYVSLPALQPVATRLHDLFLSSSRLYGSADGFLTKGWTALTSLCLNHTQLENATVTAALQLPALEDVMICRFTGHRGGELQLDQLTGSCPQVSRLEFQLGASLAQATETSRQSCRLLNLTRLADLHVTNCPDLQVLPLSLTQDLPLDLPSSLTQLKFGGSVIGGSYSVNFFWALQVAVKCVRRGAQLHKLICNCVEQSLQPAEWGASLDVQHRRLGGQLGSLRELEVWGAQKQVLNAVGAIASAAPSLARLVLVLAPRVISGVLAPRVEVSPICSASLESIRVEWQVDRRLEPPPSLVLLTFLPGCTRLQEVVVHFAGRYIKGAAIKIRCHCCSQRCIVPEEVHAGHHSDMIIMFLHPPLSEQGVQQEYTVLHASQEAKDEPWCSCKTTHLH